MTGICHSLISSLIEVVTKKLNQLLAKVPVTISLTRVFHTASYNMVTTQKKWGFPSLLREGGGTILIIDSTDSCAPPITNNSCSTKAIRPHNSGYSTKVCKTLLCPACIWDSASTACLEQAKPNGDTAKPEFSGNYPDNPT